MIGVAMRDQDRVEMLQTISQGLLTKVCRSVNDDGLAGMLDQHGHAQAFVARVVGRTRLAVAGNRRNAS